MRKRRNQQRGPRSSHSPLCFSLTLIFLLSIKRVSMPPPETLAWSSEYEKRGGYLTKNSNLVDYTSSTPLKALLNISVDL